LHRDRARQNELVRLGWEVLRFTWRDVTAGGQWITALVASALNDIRRPAAGSRA
jgi:very-short-patch-repair endonuclease